MDQIDPYALRAGDEPTPTPTTGPTDERSTTSTTRADDRLAGETDTTLDQTTRDPSDDQAPDSAATNPTPPLEPPAGDVATADADVRVLVANGTSVCGAAGRIATFLSDQGFNVWPAVKADNTADASVVYYQDGYRANAQIVASLIRLPPEQVQPLPLSPPTAPGDAHVIVHIGADDLAQPNC